MNSIIFENYDLIKRLNSINELDNLIYLKYYRTKLSRTILVNCTICQEKKCTHKMQRFYRECFYCDLSSCNLKLKIDMCHLSKTYLVYLKGQHENTLNAKNDIRNNNIHISGNSVSRSYARCCLIEKSIYREMLKGIKINQIIDPIQIKKFLIKKKIEFNNSKNIVKAIHFDSNVSLDFVKSFIYYDLNTQEYGAAGFFVSFNSYFPKGNFVKFGCYCNFFRYGSCNKKIDIRFFIDQNALLIEWKGVRCDCKKNFA